MKEISFKTNPDSSIPEDDFVTETGFNNYFLVEHSLACPGLNGKKRIQMLPNNRYINTSTGEVFNIAKHSDPYNKKRHLSKQTLRARQMISYQSYKNCWALTATYSENMTNPKRLYTDIDKFIKRIKYYLQTNFSTTFEYIICIEKQKRNAFHFHMLMYLSKSIYLSANDLEKLWGFGIISLTKSTNYEDAANYFTKINNLTSEALQFYPKNFRFYRYSRGLKNNVPPKERKTFHAFKTKMEKLGFKKIAEKSTILTIFDTEKNSFFITCITKYLYAKPENCPTPHEIAIRNTSIHRIFNCHYRKVATK